jgi:quinol---cytochrome-c reductase cytochrome c subunit
MSAPALRCAVLLAVVPLAAQALPATARGAGAPDDPATLYALRCASCHGAAGQGSRWGPPLAGVAEVRIHFMLDTGRMPASVPYVEGPHVRPAFTPAQIDRLADYVAVSIARTHDRALPAVGLGNVRRGRDLFAANCQSCHGVGGNGEAVGYGYQRVAPSLRRASAFQIAEAVRAGPGVMPRFGSAVLSDRDVSDIARYVRDVESHDFGPGGITLSLVGAAAEGLVAWVFGLGFLVLLSAGLSHAGGDPARPGSRDD